MKLPCEIVYMDEVFRSQEQTDGNYFQLLKLRMEDVPDLEMYLRITTNFTSPSAQKEMAEMFSHQVLRTIIIVISFIQFTLF